MEDGDAHKRSIMNGTGTEETEGLIHALETEMVTIKAEVEAKESASNPAHRDHVKGWDGQRGFFTIMVVMAHLNWPLARNAWIIVGFFFTLSGLLITSMTLKVYEKYGEIGIFPFYQRRVARLIPSALLVVFAICLYVAFETTFNPGKLSGIDIYWLRRDMLWATFYSSNWEFMQKGEDYFGQYGNLTLLRHFWSLAIEEQYYICWPVLLLVWTTVIPLVINFIENRGSCTLERSMTAAARDEDKKSRFRKLLISLLVGDLIVVVGSWSYQLSLLKNNAPYYVLHYSTAVHLKEFAIGGAMAAAVKLTPALKGLMFSTDEYTPKFSFPMRMFFEFFILMGHVYLLVITLANIWPDQDALFHWQFSWGSVSIALVIAFTNVIQVIQSKEMVPGEEIYFPVSVAFFSSDILATLGKVSYQTYLWHVPLIVWTNTAYQGELTWGYALSAGAVFAFIYLFSFSWSRAFEFPVLKSIMAIKEPKVVIAGMFLVMLALAGLISLVCSDYEDPYAYEEKERDNMNFVSATDDALSTWESLNPLGQQDGQQGFSGLGAAGLVADEPEMFRAMEQFDECQRYEQDFSSSSSSPYASSEVDAMKVQYVSLIAEEFASVRAEGEFKEALRGLVNVKYQNIVADKHELKEYLPQLLAMTKDQQGQPQQGQPQQGQPQQGQPQQGQPQPKPQGQPQQGQLQQGRLQQGQLQQGQLQPKPQQGQTQAKPQPKPQQGQPQGQKAEHQLGPPSGLKPGKRVGQQLGQQSGLRGMQQLGQIQQTQRRLVDSASSPNGPKFLVIKGKIVSGHSNTPPCRELQDMRNLVKDRDDFYFLYVHDSRYDDDCPGIPTHGTIDRPKEHVVSIDLKKVLTQNPPSDAIRDRSPDEMLEFWENTKNEDNFQIPLTDIRYIVSAFVVETLNLMPDLIPFFKCVYLQDHQRKFTDAKDLTAVASTAEQNVKLRIAYLGNSVASRYAYLVENSRSQMLSKCAANFAALDPQHNPHNVLSVELFETLMNFAVGNVAKHGNYLVQASIGSSDKDKEEQKRVNKFLKDNSITYVVAEDSTAIHELLVESDGTFPRLGEHYPDDARRPATNDAFNNFLSFLWYLSTRGIVRVYMHDLHVWNGVMVKSLGPYSYDEPRMGYMVLNSMFQQRFKDCEAYLHTWDGEHDKHAACFAQDKDTVKKAQENDYSVSAQQFLLQRMNRLKKMLLIIDESYLSCPKPEINGKYKTAVLLACPGDAWGFDPILSDGMHPAGSAGDFVGTNVLHQLAQDLYMEQRLNTPAGTLRTGEHAVVNSIFSTYSVARLASDEGQGEGEGEGEGVTPVDYNAFYSGIYNFARTLSCVNKKGELDGGYDKPFEV